ncbi:MAG: hypothetical protein E7208_06050 [Clostridium butyricum]|nr:hypothetical protein [Clostridium butyricum]
MKLRFLSIMCMLFIIITIIPVSASETSITISINNIDKIVLDNNIELKMAENSLKSKIQYYDDLDDDIDSLEKKISDLENSGEINESNSKLKEEYEQKKNDLKEQYEQKKNDLKIARITYQNRVREVVTSAQEKYIKYLYDKSIKEIKEEELKYNKEKNDIAKRKYDMGYISKNEYSTKIIDIIDIQNEYNKLSVDEDLSLKELKNSLGIGNKKIVIDENINFDINNIANIDFEEDFDYMISNNRNIKIKEIELEQLEDKDESDDYEIDNAELELTQEENNSRLNFQEKYNNLISSYNNIRNSINKLNDKEKAFNIMKVKLDHGYVSNKESEEKYIELINQKSEYIKDKNQLYINYLKYLQMKDGYLS